MKKLNKSAVEFCEYQCNRIQEKLRKANELELLTFASLSIELCLRQSDALELRWDQVDFEGKMLNSVKNVKKSNQIKRDIFTDYFIREDVIGLLKEWKEKSNNNDKIFPNLKRYSSGKKIGELIGDINFNGHSLRYIGITLKSKDLI